MHLKDLADLAAIIGIPVAIVGGAFTLRQWRQQTRHWLVIQRPDVWNQDPKDPDFWVFSPTKLADGYGVVVAGRLFNAGPSDAFSLRVYAEPEANADTARVAIGQAAAEVARITAGRMDGVAISGDCKAVREAMLDRYATVEDSSPLLRAGEALPFVVVAHYPDIDPYLLELLDDEQRRTALANEGFRTDRSLPWTIRGKQTHPVRARSRTSTGRRLHFAAADLCVPFERDRPNSRREAGPQPLGSTALPVDRDSGTVTPPPLEPSGADGE